MSLWPQLFRCKILCFPALIPPKRPSLAMHPFKRKKTVPAMATRYAGDRTRAAWLFLVASCYIICGPWPARACLPHRGRPRLDPLYLEHEGPRGLLHLLPPRRERDPHAHDAPGVHLVVARDDHPPVRHEERLQRDLDLLPLRSFPDGKECRQRRAAQKPQTSAEHGCIQAVQDSAVCGGVHAPCEEGRLPDVVGVSPC